MSVGVLIKEGQIGRKVLPVEKLKINNTGGGESYWVPEETTEVDSLDVSENGLYFAINDDLDGYDQVNVNVPPDMDDDDIAKGRKITGTGDDGNDYAYGLDGDGNLTVEQIPAAIHIVVPPRKLKYEEGETLNFTGIHVYLMDGNNQRFTSEDYPTGEIPFDELVFPVMVAEGSDISGSGTATIDKDYAWLDNFNLPLHFALSRCYSESTGQDGSLSKWEFYTKPASYCVGFMNGNSEQVFFLSKSPFELWWKTEYIKDGERISGTDDKLYSVTNTGFTEEGKVFYYCTQSVGLDENRNITVFENDTDESHFATILFDGTISADEIDIPTQWMRQDGMVLEDSFKIEIGEGGDEESQHADPYTGYADVSYNGHFYNINRRIVPQIHYANGYVWQEGISMEYSVEQAASMGWLILIR